MNKQGALAFIHKQRRNGKTNADIFRMASQYNNKNKARTMKAKRLTEPEFKKRKTFFETVDSLLLDSATTNIKTLEEKKKRKELEDIARYNWLD